MFNDKLFSYLGSCGYPIHNFLAQACSLKVFTYSKCLNFKPQSYSSRFVSKMVSIRARINKFRSIIQHAQPDLSCFQFFPLTACIVSDSIFTLNVLILLWNTILSQGTTVSFLNDDRENFTFNSNGGRLVSA